ncbi:hypothetical protein [Tessaracoccus coleopterorum]|uniref:hypothetical protein n=1 Tax=Tessaracoccus coleopterorum TaxID=2714950 RepID=UPI001E3BE2E6|nr:hypothetical protein [Tessaracoccus coleopterorum]
MGQARDMRYALQSFVEYDPRWLAGSHGRARFAHAVVLPYTSLPADFDAPDCPRWMVHDRDNLANLTERIADIPSDSRPTGWLRQSTTVS